MFGLPIPPSWYVFGVIILAVSAIGGCESLKKSYYKGQYEKASLELEKVNATAKAQEEQTKKVIEKQKGTTNAVRASLTDALKRLRDEQLGSRELPAPAVDPEGIAGPAPKLRLDCAPLSASLNDSLRLHFFQEWARQHGFPVE